MTDESPVQSAAPRRSRLTRWSILGVVIIAVLAAGGWGLLTWFTALQNRNVTTGIAVGRRAPGFSLPDQNGRMRNLHEVSGPRGLLLVFVRSADWWPYCRAQLVELQNDYAALQANGVGLATISYDSTAILTRFAAAHGITFPMLSDKGSRVIREYGILNTNIPKSLPLYGIPFPGQYLIGPDGMVRDKQFLNDYRERPTASEVLLKDFGASGGRKVVIRADEIQATVQLSAAKAFAGQELGVAVDFNVKPPWHVYGEPLPRNYTPTALRLDDSTVSRQAIAFPKPQPVKIASLGEVLPVYTGSFHAGGTFVLKGNLKPGDHQLSGKLSFQECNSEICKLPRTVEFALPVTVAPAIPAARR